MSVGGNATPSLSFKYPFDLTKTWPHADYPLIKVGTMTLTRNPKYFFAQIEQAAFSPGNTVPDIGLSPDKMLLGRAFAYADAQRNRIGANFHQLPVNQPKVPVNSYLFDGHMAYHHSGNAPVYAANSGGRSWADVRAALNKTVETFGRLDFAFNNAGIEYTIQPAAEVTEEEWDRIIDIDLRGVFLCMKHEIPLMLKQRRRRYRQHLFRRWGQRLQGGRGLRRREARRSWFDQSSCPRLCVIEHPYQRCVPRHHRYPDDGPFQWWDR